MAAPRTIRQSFQEYARGIAGGLMFSLPLLYTMEVWQTGFTAEPWRLALYIVVTFALLLGYNRFAGLREGASISEIIVDSVEELGLGLVLAATFLFLQGQLDGDRSPTARIGMIVTEGMTVAIGVSVGTAQLGERTDDQGDSDGNDGNSAAQTPPPGLLEQTVIALCGAVLFAANIAPTEEVIVIAYETTPVRLLGLAVLSLILGGMILYVSDFRGASSRRVGNGTLATVRGLLLTYTIALAASAMTLWFFGRFDDVPYFMMLSQTVVLGVGATLGASAGRLLLQQQ